MRARLPLSPTTLLFFAALTVGCSSDSFQSTDTPSDSLEPSDLDAGPGADSEPRVDADARTDAEAEEDAGRDAETETDGGPDAEPDAESDEDGGPDAEPEPEPECPLGAICEGEYNYAFVTSTQTTGKMGGLAGADAICNDLARAAGLPGTYVAWLSDSNTNAKDRLGSASGWLRTDRRPFARSVENLYEGKFLYPLNVDEMGVRNKERTAFTGSTGKGERVGTNQCDDWASDDASSKSRTGALGVGWGGTWSSVNDSNCSQSLPLYCFGTDHNEPVVDNPVEGRRAFITKAAFPANHSIGFADDLCQREADEAGLDGTFRAMLSTKEATAISRIPTSGETWVRADGVALWASASDAETEGKMLAPILFEADGSIASRVHFWSGYYSFASKAPSDCDKWTSAANSGVSIPVHLPERVGSFSDFAGASWSCSYDKAGIACLEAGPAEEDDGCSKTVWYLDIDGDGYGGEVTVERCEKPADGNDWVERGGDCHDGNADVHPGQTAFFGEAYSKANGSADSFDYDCDGTETEESGNALSPGHCTLVLGEGCAGSGYVPRDDRSGEGINLHCGSGGKIFCNQIPDTFTCNKSYQYPPPPSLRCR